MSAAQDLDIQEQLSRIKQQLDNSDKLRAEAAKLHAEERNFNRQAIVLLVSAAGAAAALLAAGGGIVALVLKLTGRLV